MMEELNDATPEELRRLDALRSVLHKHPSNADRRNVQGEVNIYCYRDVWGGVRISELGYSWRDERTSYGSAWMASDLDSFPYIYAAEQYLCACLYEVEDHGGGAVYDPEQEARRGLLYWLDEKHDVNALPDWEERTTNPLAKSEER